MVMDKFGPDKSSQGKTKHRSISSLKQKCAAVSVLLRGNMTLPATAVLTEENVICEPTYNNCVSSEIGGLQDGLPENIYEYRKKPEVHEFFNESDGLPHQTMTQMEEQKFETLMRQTKLSTNFRSLETYSQRESFICHDCGKHFSRKENMRKHILIVHMNQRQFICDHCQRAFGIRKDLSRHIKIVHQKDSSYKRRFMCIECNKGFSFKHHLTQHLVTHETSLEERKIFGCNRCGLRFSLRSALNRHQRTIHDKVKSYFCDGCKEGFFQKEDLCRHARRKCKISATEVLHS